MPRAALDISDIAELATPVGMTGAIASGTALGDELFEYLVGIAVLVYEMNPTL